MSFYNFNSANEQRPEGPIPEGTYCALKLTWRPGGENVAECAADDLGLFKRSMNSDVVYLVAEFTVMGGSHKGRKLWQNFTVAGGKVTEAGVSKAWNVSKDTMRAMIDSALGLEPKDMSEAAKAKRNLPSFRALDGMEFFAKIGVERGGQAPDGSQYPDKNKIAHVVVPGEPEYAVLKAGKELAPAPSANKAAPRQAPAQQPKPTWQQDPLAATQPAAATPGPAWLKGEKK